LEAEVQIRTSGAGSIEQGGINGGMKTLKLPTFNEYKDDLDAYLNRFARLKYISTWQMAVMYRVTRN